MKLGIGTVQFGMRYGISNATGQVPEQEVPRILEAAQRVGVDLLDTAFAYGTSEKVLGKYLPKADVFRIVTKTLAFKVPEIDKVHARALSDGFFASLARLCRDRVYGLLIHDCSDILAPGGEVLFDQLLAFKKQGLTDKIGVSVYSSAQIDAVLARFKIDMIQVPINVLDQRLLRSGHLARLASAGIEVHARSVYLQGLLLMKPHELPEAFGGVRQHLTQYRSILTRAGITPIEAALGFVAGLKEIGTTIVGVVSAKQLEEAALAVSRPSLPTESFQQFAWGDEAVIDPSRWNTLQTQTGVRPGA